MDTKMLEEILEEVLCDYLREVDMHAAIQEIVDRVEEELDVGEPEEE
jgi:hypothetical protein